MNYCLDELCKVETRKFRRGRRHPKLGLHDRLSPAAYLNSSCLRRSSLKSFYQKMHVLQLPFSNLSFHLQACWNFLATVKLVNSSAMEQFLLSAQHSGSISHAHTFLLPQSAAELAREVRITVAIVAVAWVAVTAIKQFGWRNQGTRW